MRIIFISLEISALVYMNRKNLSLDHIRNDAYYRSYAYRLI
jgi:hypothetical protein